MAPGATLVLPAPNKTTPHDGTEAVPSKAAKVEDVDDVTEQSSTSAAARYSTGGLIFPPPELRTIVDKTAQYVARNGIEFESKIRGDNAGSNRLAFLNEDDPFHAYYRAKLEALTTGQGPLANIPQPSDGDASNHGGSVLQADGEAAADAQRQREKEQRPTEPEPFQFLVDLPIITAMDLDIVKLTALFVSKRGRGFASSLAAREGRSYQFEFLRPSHSLFGFFNRLVEQYRTVMEPSPEMIKRVRLGAFGSEQEPAEGATPVLGMGKGGARLVMLEDIRMRAEWEKYERARRKVAEDEEEKERTLFNEIDWQDFVVVGTIELTETDAHIDLPPPMSLREVRNMSMAQKRMAAMIMDVEGGSADEAIDSVGLVDRPGERQAQAAAPATKPSKADADEGDMEMDEDSDGDEAIPTKTAVQHTPSGPMKIRKDYQPKTLAERKAAAAVQTTVCPVCHQSVPINEMDEHVRIELLNPQFREQRRELESRRAQHNALMEGADPSKVLKQFAGKRTDIFGGAAEEEAQRRREQEEARKRKERETIVWDGHAASRIDTTAEFNRPQALQQEMEQITKRFKTDQPKTYMGPQITGPIEADGGHYAAPVHMQGASIQQQPSTVPMAPAGMEMHAAAYSAPHGQHMGGGMPYGQPGGYGMPPAPPPQQQHYSGGYTDGQQAQPDGTQGQYGLEKRTDGVLYPEAQWLQYHPNPLRIVVQLPDTRSISDKCDGTQVTFDGLPPSTTIGMVRDRLQAETLGGSLGASRLKLRVEGKATTLRQSLAHWNLVDGDVLTLQVV